MRITTLPYSFSLAAATEGYQASQPFTTPYRVIHFYALGEPSPSMLLYVMPFAWSSSTLPTTGIPPGPSIFDTDILQPRIRLGRIPVDFDMDYLLPSGSRLLIYAYNGATSQQQCEVELTVGI
jgi:hypothetical protein